MKKIITLVLTFFIVHVYAQDPTLRITSHTTDTDSDVKKPLIKLSYQGNNVVLGRFANIDGINPDWISSVNVLKGKTAIALYGKDGEDGVISIGLKPSPEIKAFFENEAAIYKKLTKIDKWQDASQRAFEEEKRNQSFQGQTIKLRGETHQLPNPPLTIIQYNDQSLQLDEFSQLDEIGANYIKSVEVLKDELSLERYGAKDQGGVVILTMQSSKKAGKAFKKLKKALKKND